MVPSTQQRPRSTPLQSVDPSLIIRTWARGVGCLEHHLWPNAEASGWWVCPVAEWLLAKGGQRSLALVVEVGRGLKALIGPSSMARGEETAALLIPC